MGEKGGNNDINFSNLLGFSATIAKDFSFTLRIPQIRDMFFWKGATKYVNKITHRTMYVYRRDVMSLQPFLITHKLRE